jgi:hypothetical protein
MVTTKNVPLPRDTENRNAFGTAKQRMQCFGCLQWIPDGLQLTALHSPPYHLSISSGSHEVAMCSFQRQDSTQPAGVSWLNGVKIRISSIEEPYISTLVTEQKDFPIL